MNLISNSQIMCCLSSYYSITDAFIFRHGNGRYSLLFFSGLFQRRQFIKAVRYNVGIAPVVLDTLTPVKLQVDSILGGFPLVNAQVDSAGTILKGEVKAAGRTKLIKALKKLPLRSIKDSLNFYTKSY